ncbi:MAG: hypothetical protein LBP38_02115 [Desulfovibrio sp.]|jgi:hypothetical protein|nr:hypothetical protein [Desulfovibrio sp.]
MKDIIQCVLFCFFAGVIFAEAGVCAEGGRRSPSAAASGVARPVRSSAPVKGIGIVRRGLPAEPRVQATRSMPGEILHAGAGTPKAASAAISSQAGRKSGAKKNRTAKPGLAGFAAAPFTAAGADSQHDAPKTRIYGPDPEQKKAEAPMTLGDKQNITVSAQSEPQQTARLAPGRAAFSGGPERMGRINETESPEVSMSYKLNPEASGRVTVNPNDPDSPLYRPPERNRNLSGAGLYMDMSVREDLNVTLGGEYSDVQDTRPAGRTDGAAGASLGFTWNF